MTITRPVDVNAKLLRRVWLRLAPDGPPVEVTMTALLGRLGDSDVVVPDRACSRSHVRVDVGADVVASDLGSASGTLLRRGGEPPRRLVREALQHGDELIIGSAVIAVFIDDDGASGPADAPTSRARDAARAQALQSLEPGPGVLPPGVDPASAVFVDGVLKHCRWVGPTHPEHGAWKTVVTIEARCPSRVEGHQSPFARPLPALEQVLHATEAALWALEGAVAPKLQLLSVAVPLDQLRTSPLLKVPPVATFRVEPALDLPTRKRLSTLLPSMCALLSPKVSFVRIATHDAALVPGELRASLPATPRVQVEDSQTGAVVELPARSPPGL